MPFVFAYAKSRFSYDTAHTCMLYNMSSLIFNSTFIGNASFGCVYSMYVDIRFVSGMNYLNNDLLSE